MRQMAFSLMTVLCGLLAGCGTPVAPAPPQAQMEAPVLLKWSDLVSRPRPVATREIRTGAGASDVVDVWLPEGDGPFPVVVMVHGGCWQKEIADRTLMDWAAEDLRQRGLAVWNIEYRGVDEPGGGYPGTFEDVARAADALRDHAGELNLDTQRIAAIGHSAGGHLALWLAARGNLPETSPLWSADPLPIGLIVNSGGLADLEASAPVTQAECLANVMSKLTGAASEARPDVFGDTSPARLLPFPAEQVSVNGANDRIAPPVLGQSYTDKASLAGSAARYVEVPASGHVELVTPGTSAFDAEAEILTEWFAK